jgi:hypothetical protein
MKKLSVFTSIIITAALISPAALAGPEEIIQVAKAVKTLEKAEKAMKALKALRNARKAKAIPKKVAVKASGGYQVDLTGEPGSFNGSKTGKLKKAPGFPKTGQKAVFGKRGEALDLLDDRASMAAFSANDATAVSSTSSKSIPHYQESGGGSNRLETYETREGRPVGPDDVADEPSRQTGGSWDVDGSSAGNVF